MTRIRYYKDRKGEHRWTLFINGRKVACCGEGYKNAAHVRRMVAKLFPWLKVPKKAA